MLILLLCFTARLWAAMQPWTWASREQETTPVMPDVISCPKSGGQICLSISVRTLLLHPIPSMQLQMDSEATESVLISESTQASDDGALLHLGEQPT